MFHVLHVSRNATRNRFQRFLFALLFPNRKKKVKNCVDLLQKKKILKVKSNLFLFNLQATSNGNCIHRCHAPSIQDGTRPPLTRCPFFMKITFLHNSTGEGRKSSRAKAKRKSMKGNFSTSFRQSGIFYDATWAPSACCCCCCIDH